jgi:hypothetical protein
MAGHWNEVVRLEFKGERFRDRALDSSALGELQHFLSLVAETAKTLWRTAHPGRECLPAHFEQRARLVLRRIDDGSAVAPLEVYVDDPAQGSLLDPEPTEVTEAIALVHDVYESAESDRLLPDGLPKDLLPLYVDLGRTLGPNEEIEIQPVGGTARVARVNVQTRERLQRRAETSHLEDLDVVGEVLEADVRLRRFQLWIDDRTAVAVSFTEAQEALVTEALRDHRAVRLRVRGRAEVSASGKPIRFIEIGALEPLSAGEAPLGAEAPSIESALRDIASRIPKSEWEKLPQDLTDQIDHHVYGTPRR